MFGRGKLSPENLNLLTAGTMIPSCTLVAWLIFKWMAANGWAGRRWEWAFVLFGIVTGFYNFFRMIRPHGPKSS